MMKYHLRTWSPATVEHPEDGTSAIGKRRRRVALYQRGLALARWMLFGGGGRESRPVHPMLNGHG